MKQIQPDERESAKAVFQNSIYQNSHLGWLSLDEIYNAGGQIWLDVCRKRNYLIAVQPSESKFCWLHSFYADASPQEYPLAQKLRGILRARRQPVCTISSHSWFNKLLEKNQFRKCDEIVEMETAKIMFPGFEHKNFSLSYEITAEAVISCEHAFPPMWRLTPAEVTSALNTSSYKLSFAVGSDTAGFLLADFYEENCHIQRIAIKPEFQHKGAATEMLRQMLFDAQNAGIKTFSVNTNLHNDNAVQFYKNMNFTIQGKRYPVYYRYL